MQNEDYDGIVSESTENIVSPLELPTTATVEIELDNFSKEDFIHILSAMHEKDMTFNQFVVYALEQMIAKYESLPDDATVEVVDNTDSGLVQTALTDKS